jgi:hypothetical protein
MLCGKVSVGTVHQLVFIVNVEHSPVDHQQFPILLATTCGIHVHLKHSKYSLFSGVSALEKRIASYMCVAESKLSRCPLLISLRESTTRGRAFYWQQRVAFMSI